MAHTVNMCTLTPDTSHVVPVTLLLIHGVRSCCDLPRLLTGAQANTHQSIFNLRKHSQRIAPLCPSFHNHHHDF